MPLLGQTKANEVLADHGDWLEIDISTRSFPEERMLIDKEDWAYFLTLPFGRVFAHLGRGHRKYAMSALTQIGHTEGGGRIHPIHRVLLNPPKDKVTDHINHDTLDNRRNNIRTCSQAENNQNAGPRPNSSGFTGVDAWGNRWRARIRIQGKVRHLGMFDTPEEAHAQYLSARKEAFREFA